MQSQPYSRTSPRKRLLLAHTCIGIGPFYFSYLGIHRDPRRCRSVRFLLLLLKPNGGYSKVLGLHADYVNMYGRHVLHPLVFFFLPFIHLFSLWRTFSYLVSRWKLPRFLPSLFRNVLYPSFFLFQILWYAIELRSFENSQRFRELGFEKFVYPTRRKKITFLLLFPSSFLAHFVTRGPTCKSVDFGVSKKIWKDSRQCDHARSSHPLPPVLRS